MEATNQDFVEVIEAMTSSLSTARVALQSIKQKEMNLDVSNGISILSLKHHILLSYLQSLTLVASQRVLGNTLNARSPPAQPFSTKDRESRGNHPGDLVDSIIENRVVLEKTEVLESKMRYQITKLVRITDEPTQSEAATDNPLAFKPNPMSFVQNDSALSEERTASRNLDEENEMDGDGIYRPPRLAPMPYVEKSKTQARQKRPPVPSALATLADPSQPFTETTSGLGGAPALNSGRAQYLKRLKDFEEENFTRVVMKKGDVKRRARDEEDLALGGDLAAGSGPRGRRGAGGLEDEFSEVLRSVSRVSGGRSQGDGYEELRKRGRKMDVLERSRAGSKKRDASEPDGAQDSQRQKKRSRFELETKTAKKKFARR